MNEKREIKGIWFLPSSPEIEVGGILTYEPGKLIKLELIGDLMQRTDFTAYFDSSNHEVIYGITSTGKNISLYECYGSSTVTTYAVPLTSYSASAFIEGKHQQNPLEAVFDQIEVDFPQLERWLGKDAYKMERHMVKPKFYHTTIEYNPNYSFSRKYQIEDDFELELNLHALARRTSGVCTIKNLSTATISIKDQELSIWDLLRRMEVFRSFLSLGLLQAVPYDFIKVREKLSGEFINYVFLERGARYSIKSKAFLYNFGRFESSLGNVLKSWYDTTGDMFPIRVHLLEAILDRPNFRSTDFMILAFAIEGFYHRFLKKSGAKTGNLIAAISNIQRIFKDLSFISKIKVDAQEVNDSRNYYAHLYQKDPSKKILNGVDLLKISEKIKVLLVLSMLKQMALEIPEIEKHVANSDLLKTVNSF